MKIVESARQVKSLLGEKYSKSKARGVYPDQREVVTMEKGKTCLFVKDDSLAVEEMVVRQVNGKMKGLVFGSGLTVEKRFTEKAEGREYLEDCDNYPNYYRNEP